MAIQKLQLTNLKLKNRFITYKRCYTIVVFGLTKIKNMNREKLVEQLIAIREQEKEIRKQLDAVDYEERFNDAKQYEGRYFKEVNDHHKESVRCLFVYATDIENCNPMALCVSYWVGNETSYFEIEYYGHFHPKKWDEDIDKWIEISKDEYQQHYVEVQRRISFAVSAKNNVV